MTKNSRRRYAWGAFLGLVFLLLALLYFPWSSLPRRKKTPPPAPRCEMTLELARRQWHVGEAPWYLLTVKNSGKQEFILDRFMFNQADLSRNSDYRAQPGGIQRGEGIYFEIRRPDGSVMTPDFLGWGFHGEFHFWANADTERKPPNFTEERMFKPGGTFTATPTIVKPIEAPAPGRLGDMRFYLKKGSHEEHKGAEDLLAVNKEERQITGLIGEVDLNPKVLYPGYRVLEGYSFSRPGIYRMKVIYDHCVSLPWSSAEDQIQEEAEDNKLQLPYKELPTAYKETVRKEWLSKSPQQLEKLKKERTETEEYNKLEAFHCESNEVDLEVAP